MNALQYWVGALILASVKRHYALDLHVDRSHHNWFYSRKGGYRSLLFKLNSTAFHHPERLGLQ